MRFLPLLLVLPLLGLGCSSEPAKATYPTVFTEPAETLPEGNGLHVLFLGNSLTAGNELPALVTAMAAAGGVKMDWLAWTPGNYNLEDHWNAAKPRQMLAKSRWDFVVLQQGPSSLPESQADLKKWAAIWAVEIRKHKATPALYMVWPFQGQRNGFKLVSQSYRNAATAAQALVLPAGEAWEEALQADPTLPLYAGDKLHPEEAGTYLAALVITHGLTGVEPDKVPATLKLSSTRVYHLPETQAAKLRQTAAKVIARNKTAAPAK
jgi:hypothetical protein